MFIMIPEKVDTDMTIHSNSKRLIGHIISLNRSSLGCLAGNRYLADKIGVSIPTINRYLTELKDREYIEIDFIERGKNKNPQRIIIPSTNILNSINATKTKLTNKMKLKDKNLLPRDIEADWLDDYIANLD